MANPHLPNRLLPMLRAQGFSSIEVAALPIINTRLAPDTFSFETIRRLARNAVESGAVGAAAAESWQEELHRQSRDGSYFFSVNRFLFTASRP